MTCSFQAYENLHSRPDAVAALHALLEEVEDGDGVAALSEAFLKGIDADQGHRHIVAVEAGDADGADGSDAEEGTDLLSQPGAKAVGVLALDGEVSSSETGENPTAEMAVTPGERRKGVARGMLAAAKEEFGLTGPLDVWAHGDLPPAQAMAETAGARRTRELHKMAVDVSEGTERGQQFRTEATEAAKNIEAQNLTVLTYPEAVERFGQELVDEEWVRVNNEAFAWHPEQGGWDVDRLADARDTDWFDPAGVLMVWSCGEDEDADGPHCAGFHWTKIPTEEQEKQEGTRAGEVYVVCLADEARGKGLGPAITMLGIGDLMGRGVGTVELYVEGDNAPAVATYQKLGFEIVHTDVVYRGELN